MILWEESCIMGSRGEFLMKLTTLKQIIEKAVLDAANDYMCHDIQSEIKDPRVNEHMLDGIVGKISRELDNDFGYARVFNVYIDGPEVCGYIRFSSNIDGSEDDITQYRFTMFSHDRVEVVEE